MSSRSSIDVQAGDKYRGMEICHITRRARAQCAFLDALDHHSSLPETSAETLQVILRYLNGQDLSLPAHDYSGSLASFGQIWALAAQLDLPHLQNHLIDRYQTLYAHACHVRDSHQTHKKRHDFSPDTFLAMAFEALEMQCGKGSPAEDFLIAFVARFALDVQKLEDYLHELRIAARIKNRMLEEARDLSADPIKHDIDRFKIDISEKQSYDPPKVLSPTECARRVRALEAQSITGKVARRHEESVWGIANESDRSEMADGFFTTESTEAMSPDIRQNQLIVPGNRRQSSSREHTYTNSVLYSQDMLWIEHSAHGHESGEQSSGSISSGSPIYSPLPQPAPLSRRATAPCASGCIKEGFCDCHQQSPRRTYRTRKFVLAALCQ